MTILRSLLLRGRKNQVGALMIARPPTSPALCFRGKIMEINGRTHRQLYLFFTDGCAYGSGTNVPLGLAQMHPVKLMSGTEPQIKKFEPQRAQRSTEGKQRKQRTNKIAPAAATSGERRSSPALLERSHLCAVILIGLAGTPTAKTPAGRSLIITPPAPTVVQLPIFTPGITALPIPKKTPSPNRTPPER